LQVLAHGSELLIPVTSVSKTSCQIYTHYSVYCGLDHYMCKCSILG